LHSIKLISYYLIISKGKKIYQVKNVIALFIYNKSDTTNKVLQKILSVKPKTLIVIADGPKGEKNDIENVKNTRKLIKNIDTNCNLVTNFSESNLGLKDRFSTGMNFIFDHTEQAIILEDDCLPTEGFFRFCDEILEKYREEKSISMISGYNYHGITVIKDSYYFSMYSNIWGWATWKDRWNNFYDSEMVKYQEIKNQKSFSNIFINSDQEKFISKEFDKVLDKSINTWDYQWTFTNLINKRLSIVPKNNLVKNIGLGHVNATHTKRKFKALLKTLNIRYFIKFPLKHPSVLRQNVLLDIKENRKKIIDNSKLSKFIYLFKKLLKLN